MSKRNLRRALFIKGIEVFCIVSTLDGTNRRADAVVVASYSVQAARVTGISKLKNTSTSWTGLPREVTASWKIVVVTAPQTGSSADGSSTKLKHTTGIFSVQSTYPGGHLHMLQTACGAPRCQSTWIGLLNAVAHDAIVLAVMTHASGQFSSNRHGNTGPGTVHSMAVSQLCEEVYEKTAWVNNMSTK